MEVKLTFPVEGLLSHTLSDVALMTFGFCMQVLGTSKWEFVWGALVERRASRADPRTGFSGGL
jgi:hypothetical protein